ncbi:cytochrome P450 [Streptacidiphilus sp. MAP12-16]|uniref:cytochrome P450 family protein n=1 Tax=Streptacidiphilus sp. MAP12-16 TaxID=3156300 RepID=UPI003512631E
MTTAQPRQDPLTRYAKLTAAGPIHRARRLDGSTLWVITRAAEARVALADPRLRMRPPAGGGPEVPSGIPARYLFPYQDHLAVMDPPDHTLLRRLVSATFTPRRVEALRPRIQEITDGLLDGLDGRGEADLIQELALPLPIAVIGELLGIPEQRRAEFRDWADTIVGANPEQDQATLGERQAALDHLYDYLTGLIADKRRQPGEDLLSALTEAAEDEQKLTDGQLLSMSFLLLVAGYETTAGLIANSVLALLSAPGRLAALRAEPALLPGAVEELLRHCGPVDKANNRFAVEEIRIGAAVIQPGDQVQVALTAANRDPRAFDADPGELDLRRGDGSRHLAFGHGIHYCLGARLAKAEAEIAIGTLLGRFGELEVAVPVDELPWRVAPLLHDVRQLPVRLSPRSTVEGRPAESWDG